MTDVIKGRKVRFRSGAMHGTTARVLDSFVRDAVGLFPDGSQRSARKQYCLVVEILDGPALPPDYVGLICIVPVGPNDGEAEALLEQTP